MDRMAPSLEEIIERVETARETNEITARDVKSENQETALWIHSSGPSDISTVKCREC